MQLMAPVLQAVTAPLAAISEWRTMVWLATFAVGLLYPASRSVAALEVFSPMEAARWMSFWMWRAALEVVLMPLLGLLLGWTGVMPELHLAALAWLALPQTNGALFMWHSVMLPAVLLGRQLLVRSGLVKDDQLGAGDKVLLTTPRALAAATKTSTAMMRIGAAIRANQLAAVELASRGGGAIARNESAFAMMDDVMRALQGALEEVQAGGTAGYPAGASKDE